MSRTNDTGGPGTADPKPPVMPKDGGAGCEIPTHGAGHVSKETRAEVDPKNDGDPNVAGDVRGA